MKLLRDRYHNLSGPAKWSIGIHLAFFFIALIGLPDWFQSEPDIPEPQEIIVDLVTIDDVTAAPNTTREKPKEKEPPPPPKPVEEKKPEPEKPKKEKPKMAPKSVPPEEIKQVSQPKDKPAPPVEKLEKAPALIPAKPDMEEVKKEDEKEEPPQPEQEEFTSVLKNLVGEEEPEKPKEKKPELKIDAPVDKEKPVGKAPVVADSVTATEIDLLKKQLGRCWNIPIGARDAQNLVVDIDVRVNRERRVLSADIVDTWRYRSDPFFRTAAESARRALLSPHCSPLALPPEKYDVWKYMRISFNPREMFGGP